MLLHSTHTHNNSGQGFPHQQLIVHASAETMGITPLNQIKNYTTSGTDECLWNTVAVLKRKTKQHTRSLNMFIKSTEINNDSQLMTGSNGCV